MSATARYCATNVRQGPATSIAVVEAITGGKSSTLALRGGAVRRGSRRGELVGVTYIIAEPCIDIRDRSCIEVCPVDCIHEHERMLVIDPADCIDCAGCEPERPVEAIFPKDALPQQMGSVCDEQLCIPGLRGDQPARRRVRA